MGYYYGAPNPVSFTPVSSNGSQNAQKVMMHPHIMGVQPNCVPMLPGEPSKMYQKITLPPATNQQQTSYPPTGPQFNNPSSNSSMNSLNPPLTITGNGMVPFQNTPHPVQQSEGTIMNEQNSQQLVSNQMNNGQQQQQQMRINNT
eukprot:UN05850